MVSDQPNKFEQQSGQATDAIVSLLKSERRIENSQTILQTCNLLHLPPEFVLGLLEVFTPFQ